VAPSERVEGKEEIMSTTTQSLPVGSSFRARLVVAAAILAIATVVTLAIFAPGTMTAGTPNHQGPSVTKVTDARRAPPYHPIMINGQVCGQCR
jgi:hypothetical protein